MSKNCFGDCLGNFWNNLGYFLFNHLITLLLRPFTCLSKKNEHELSAVRYIDRYEESFSFFVDGTEQLKFNDLIKLTRLSNFYEKKRDRRDSAFKRFQSLCIKYQGSSERLLPWWQATLKYLQAERSPGLEVTDETHVRKVVGSIPNTLNWMEIFLIYLL